jgi:hypothetical protein
MIKVRRESKYGWNRAGRGSIDADEVGLRVLEDWKTVSWSASRGM